MLTLRPKTPDYKEQSMETIVIVLIVLFLLGGGGYWYRGRRGV